MYTDGCTYLNFSKFIQSTTGLPTLQPVDVTPVYRRSLLVLANNNFLLAQ